MKILNTSQFIIEWVKVKPVTNAEWENFRKETTFKYESLLKEGNIVDIKETNSTATQVVRHIVMTKETYNKIFPDEPSIDEYDYILCEWDDHIYYGSIYFRLYFPFHSNGDTKIIKIIDAGINLKNINTKDDLDKIFDKYRDVQ